MNTIDAISEVDADTKAIVEHAMTGKPLDPEMAKRVRQAAQKITDRVFHQHGVLDIGVPAIRELRGELPES